MATRTTLNVSLPVELGRFVESMVVSGHYTSASEVVRTALRLLQERETRLMRIVPADSRVDHKEGIE